MSVHELATNAAKYGARSVPTGSIALTWAIAPSDPPYLVLHWQEQGGPPVEAPTSKGFGTRLIERSLARELADVRLIYAREGLICVISVPLTEQPLLGESEQSFSGRSLPK